MLTLVLLAVVAVLAAGEFLLFGALAEAYRDIRQIREQAGVLDKTAPVDLGRAHDQRPSMTGMHPALDAAASAVVVYVDTRCGTCRMIVGSLNGGIPRGVWLAVIAESEHDAFDWLSKTAAIFPGSESGQRVMVTSPAEVEKHLGQVFTPLAIEIENGRLARAKAVPSVRKFYSLVPTLISLSTPIEQEVS